MDIHIASNAFAKAYLSARRHQATGAVQIPVVTDAQSNLVGVGRPADWPTGVAEKVMRKTFRVQYLETVDCYRILKHTLLDPFQAPASQPPSPAKSSAATTLTRVRSYSVFERTKVGHCADKGNSDKMEDEHTVVIQLNQYMPDPFHGLPLQSYFGVYDGHGGRGAAVAVRDQLHRLVCAAPSFVEDPSQGLKEAFQTMEHLWGEQSAHTEPMDSSGTTVVAMLVRGDAIFIANLGDCRAVLCHNGKPEDLSEDHKPSLTTEKERIVREGGTVEYGFLNGELAVSRAIGDLDYTACSAGRKPPGLSAIPEVLERTLIQGDEFVVLACDGLWDVINSQRAVEDVRADLIRHGDVQQAAQDLVSRAVKAPFYSEDNVTVVIVSFMSEEKRRQLKDDQVHDHQQTASTAGKKWVPRFRRVQMDSITAALKDPSSVPQNSTSS